MTTPWGGEVSFRPTTTSTMDDAQALEIAGWPAGSLAWAGYQSAGQGRHRGRTWIAEAGASLLFTVFWSPETFTVPSFAPSLTVGLGLCRWLESLSGTGGSVALKWPNDVYWEDRKLAGILVRRRLSASTSGSVHAGIGINLTRPPEAGFRTAPAALCDLGPILSPAEALEGLLPYLASALADADPRGGCEQRLWRLHQFLSLSLPDGSVHSGLVQGLDPSGGLLLEGPSGVEVVSSGE